MTSQKKHLTGIFLFLTLILISSVLASGCFALNLFHKDVQESPAPTTIPLPTKTPTSEAEPAAPVEPTQTPETKSEAEAPPTEIVPPQEEVQLPPGFGISEYVSGLKGPRMMTLGPDQALYVAERSANRIIRLPDKDQDGVADGIEVAADGLNAPSSIAFYKDGSLYVGETQQILRLTDPDGDGYFQESEIIIDGIPAGGHSTRTVLFSPDWEYLYVSIGSSCNVCLEDDPRRATIMRYRPDGSEEELYADGLRNAVGITFRSGTEELWATNNGRDWLGDEQPPETIYRVEQGDDAGWPRCHSGRIIDPDFGEAGDCEGILDPVVEMQAHSAPLGHRFYTGTKFPEEYQGDLFVAFHGSWNRSDPTGYKVVRIPVDDQGNATGGVIDFAAGWLREDGSQWGRPVDVLTGPDGSLFISDDGAGRIYRVFYSGE
jgi:glucose/arabinose dehydrogenase